MRVGLDERGEGRASSRCSANCSSSTNSYTLAFVYGQELAGDGAWSAYVSDRDWARFSLVSLV